METTCPICHSKSKKIRAFAQRKDEKLDLCECLSCGQQFLSPYPSNDWLSEEYSHYYTKRQAGLARAKTEYFKKLFKEIGAEFNERSILEFGPGEGDAIAAVRESYRPSSITAVERNEEANALFQDLNCKYFNMFLEEYISSDPDQEKFDYIFLFDVLEHLKDPVQVLKDLREKKLKSRGMLIATFPVADSLSRKVFDKVWPQYKVEHLNYFTDKSIHIMADKSGLKLVKNEVLVKTLSLDYLLNVGRGFGPDAFKKLSAGVANITPKKIKNLNLSMGYGEKLVLLQN
ncbi:MAG: class I SAM-dependent methyltransferase [Bacteriovoracia bacterium]